jgi:serine phosphatase RsbU (regulator of sigma subunit)
MSLNTPVRRIAVAQRDVKANAAIEQDLREARAIQQRLVPRQIAIPGLDVAISFEPCKCVGGDYVDVVPMPEGRALLAVADVCGKGLQAALVASSVHTLVRSAVRSRLGLADLMNGLNEHLCEYLPSASFVTMFAAVLDCRTGNLQYANAGHPAAMIFGGNEPYRQLEATATPLGISSQPIAVRAGQLNPGELLALFTDGWTDLPGPSGAMPELPQFYWLVHGVWSKSSEAPASTFIEKVTQLLGKYLKGSSAADDRTFLAVRRTRLKN